MGDSATRLAKRGDPDEASHLSAVADARCEERDSGDDGRQATLDEVERAILVALAHGQVVADIATTLRISEDRLGLHMANVLAKLHRQHSAPLAREPRSRRPGPVGGERRPGPGELAAVEPSGS